MLGIFASNFLIALFSLGCAFVSATIGSSSPSSLRSPSSWIARARAHVAASTPTAGGGVVTGDGVDDTGLPARAAASRSATDGLLLLMAQPRRSALLASLASRVAVVLPASDAAHHALKLVIVRAVSALRDHFSDASGVLHG